MNGQKIESKMEPVISRLLLVLILFMALLPKARAQEIQINGKVVSATDSEPLPGVSVVLKGTTTGSTTDINGEFSVVAPADGVLIFSFIGMTTQEVEINSQSTINVRLEEERTGLEEVVVVGYGTQKKVNLSGAVNSIDTKELENRPIVNLSQGLQGVAPNLNIDFVSGEPGQAARVNIRGTTSINGGEPLILIDGVPAPSAELNRLAPEDVADISVLKDASSAAIYGARAAFGVLLITTQVPKMVLT